MKVCEIIHRKQSLISILFLGCGKCRPRVLSVTGLDSVSRNLRKGKWYVLIFLNRDNDIDELYMGMTFSVDNEEFGKVVEHELKPGGTDIEVTDANKKEYIE